MSSFLVLFFLDSCSAEFSVCKAGKKASVKVGEANGAFQPSTARLGSGELIVCFVVKTFPVSQMECCSRSMNSVGECDPFLRFNMSLACFC